MEVKGNFINYGSYIDVHDNEVVNLTLDGSGRVNIEQAVEVATLTAPVADVREYFWGDSSMATVFCVCRDCFGYPDNMSMFERDFRLTEGLLSGTFRNNPYMRLHVDKWKENGAKERVLKLVEAYRKAVAGRLAK